MISWPPSIANATRRRGHARICAAALVCVFAASFAHAQDREAGAVQEIDGISFVWCPPGAFTMGGETPPGAVAERYGGDAAWYADEQPTREVRFEQGFWLSATPITVSQWERVMGSLPTALAPEDREENRPVTGVDWSEAGSFAERLTGQGLGAFRLPTEAEWEYAYRAGATTAFFCGDNAECLRAHAAFRPTAAGKVQPVAAQEPNAWGLYDMAGNVWEWSADRYGPHNTPPTQREPGYKAIRGGAANSTAPYLRAAFRAGLDQNTKSPRLGFRVLLEDD